MAADASQQRAAVVRRLLSGVGICGALLVIGYFSVVSTRWGHSLDNDAYFGRDASGRSVVKFDGEFLDHVTKGTLLLLLVAVFLVSLVRRIPVIGVCAAAGVVVAVAGAEVLKKVLPWEVLVPSDLQLGLGLQAETYPSGHATIGSSLALAGLMVCPANWRAWGSVVAGMVCAMFGTGVVFAGWHRPSDAVGGFLWAGVVMGLVAVLAVTLRKSSIDLVPQTAARAKLRRQTIVGSIAAAFVTYGAIVIAALTANSGLPDADRAFVILAGVIVAGAFAVPNWFGNALSAVQWQVTSDQS